MRVHRTFLGVGLDLEGGDSLTKRELLFRKSPQNCSCVSRENSQMAYVAVQVLLESNRS